MNRYHATPWSHAAAAVAVAATSLIAGSVSAQEPMWAGGRGTMELTSAAFANGNSLPAAGLYNDIYPPGSTYNVCSATGATGGDQSPQLLPGSTRRTTREASW
jgi:hypothetical protein